jgi:hypothetical protein
MDDIKAIREALHVGNAHAQLNCCQKDSDQIEQAIAILDRIEAQKPRVPMAMLLDVAGIPPYHPDRIKRIAEAYGVEVSE